MAMTSNPRLAAVEVLNFWFGYTRQELRAITKPDKAQMSLWFGSREEDDATIKMRFGAHVAETSAKYDTIDDMANRNAPMEHILADIIALDQFTRSIHRKTARAFENDDKALRLANVALERATEISILEKMFVELPLMHSENIVDHERLLALRGIAPPSDANAALESKDWAVKHWAVIKKFNRYPHRNAALGRRSTAEEEAYLAAGASSFGQ